MSDVEMVIKIPEKIYEIAKQGNWKWPADDVYNAIKNGIPLQKGHGRIADMDAAIKCIKECEGDDAIWAISLIDWACGKRTIIEADKEYEDKDCYGAKDVKAYNMAIKALEKDIPKAPKKSDMPRYGMGYEYYDWYCPTCNKFLAFECDTKRQYIHHCECGQRLDWGKAL